MTELEAPIRRTPTTNQTFSKLHQQQHEINDRSCSMDYYYYYEDVGDIPMVSSCRKTVRSDKSVESDHTTLRSFLSVFSGSVQTDEEQLILVTTLDIMEENVESSLSPTRVAMVTPLMDSVSTCDPEIGFLERDGKFATKTISMRSLHDLFSLAHLIRWHLAFFFVSMERCCLLTDHGGGL